MSKLTDFDINELVLQLHHELQFAFKVADSEGRNSFLQLSEVKARLGRKQIADNLLPENSNENMLNPLRYPNGEDWEVEVAYKYCEAGNNISSDGGRNTLNDKMLLFDRFAHLPIDKLKGIDARWREVFIKEGLINFKLLKDCTEEKIVKMCNGHHSFKPVYFQNLVYLLNCEYYPVNSNEFGKIPLLHFLAKTKEEIEAGLKGKLTKAEIDSLKSAISTVFLVVDQKFVSKLTLDYLLKN